MSTNKTIEKFVNALIHLPTDTNRRTFFDKVKDKLPRIVKTIDDYQYLHLHLAYFGFLQEISGELTARVAEIMSPDNVEGIFEIIQSAPFEQSMELYDAVKAKLPRIILASDSPLTRFEEIMRWVSELPAPTTERSQISSMENEHRFRKRCRKNRQVADQQIKQRHFEIIEAFRNDWSSILVPSNPNPELEYNLAQETSSWIPFLSWWAESAEPEVEAAPIVVSVEHVSLVAKYMTPEQVVELYQILKSTLPEGGLNLSLFVKHLTSDQVVELFQTLKRTMSLVELNTELMAGEFSEAHVAALHGHDALTSSAIL